MRIPTGNYGFGAGAAPVQRMRIGDPGAPDAAAIGNLGQTITQIGGQMKEEHDALARVKANNALSDYEVQLSTARADFEARLTSGEVDYNKAGEEWGKVVGSMPAPKAPDGMDPVLAESFNGGIAQHRKQAGFRVDEAARQAMYADFRNQTRTALDKNEQLASATGQTEVGIQRNEAMVPLLQRAGYDKDQIGKMLADSSERIWTNEATSRINASDTSIDQLKALDTELTADNGRYFDKMDPAKRTALSAQVKNRIDQLNNAARIEVDRREAKAEKAVKAMMDLAVTGTPYAPESLALWHDQVKGTSFEAAYNGAIAASQEVQQVLRLSPEQQQTYIQQREAHLAQAGGSMDDKQRIDALRTAIDKNAEMQRNAPLLFAQARTGIPIKPIDFGTLQSGDATEVGRVLSDRMVTLRAMRSQYGPQVQARPLLPQEAAILSASIQKSTPDQAAGLFGTLSQTIGDPQAYNAVMAQIAPGDPVSAYAGVIYAKQRGGKPGALTVDGKNVGAGDVARTMLHGQALLNPKPDASGKAQAGIPAVTVGKFSQSFDEVVGDAFRGRPEARRMAVEAARAFYVGTMAESGQDASELDDKAAAEAVRATLGDVTEIGGHAIVAPWGMDADTFRGKLQGAWEGLTGTRVGKDGPVVPRKDPQVPSWVTGTYDDYEYVSAGDGQYYVVGSDGKFIPNIRGQRLVLKVE